MYETYRGGDKKKLRFVPKQKPKKFPQDFILNKVREIIMQMWWEDVDPYRVRPIHFTAEDLAKSLNCEVHRVVCALGVLNREGLVSHKKRFCRRPQDSGWAANRYHITKPSIKIPIRTEMVILGPDTPKGMIAVIDEEEGYSKKSRHIKRKQCCVGEEDEI